MAEARVEAFYEARKRLQSIEPIPARIEVLKGEHTAIQENLEGLLASIV